MGCDHELGSKAVSDACGVCKGDNSTCKFYKGLYLSQHKANGKSHFHPLDAPGSVPFLPLNGDPSSPDTSGSSCHRVRFLGPMGEQFHLCIVPE